MPRDGAGTYNLPTAPVVNGTPISDTDENTTRSDLAAALTQSLSKDGQTIPTANLPMGTYKHTNVGTATARNEYATLGQVQDGAAIWGGTAGGTANALTLTLSPAITAYTAGLDLVFIASATNTGSMTINVNGVGAAALTGITGAGLAAGQIVSGSLVRVFYTGSGWRLLNAPSLPTAVASTGEWRLINSGSGVPLVLPAGGTWSYFYFGVTGAGGFSGNFGSSVAAGGATLQSAVGGVTFIGFAWRFA